MSVKCLGKPKIPEDLRIITAIPRPGEQNFKGKTEYIIRPEKYLELHGKRYLPLKGIGEIDKSENSCVNVIRRSKKEAQLVGEIKKSIGGSENVNDLTLLRLWLYGGKIYEVDRNDYDKKQVKLLILDFLDKEKKKIQKLKQKYEFGKEADSG